MQGALERKLAARRERDRARRQAKRTAEVWAMPADEVPTEEGIVGTLQMPCKTGLS